MLKKIIPLIVIVVLPAFVVWAILLYQNREYDNAFDYKEMCEKEVQPSVYHQKLPELQMQFNSPQEVTKACISCHTERHKEVLKTPHWKWERETNIPGRGVKYIGKANLLNNFCIGIAGSEQTCTRCHIGYGWKDKSFDFTDHKNVDCLACHDNSGLYEKKKGGAGYPKESVNLMKVAQSVGAPQMKNCGTCHFFSGGGNNVKHGDLEKALYDCTKDVDVHMGTDGGDMECIECHTAENHQLKGKLYAVSSENKNRATCEQCHTDKPHKDRMLNSHFDKVSCQACHIPKYAKVNATKMYWDWSTAGKLDDQGKPYHENDEAGNHTYLSIKGSFEYGTNVIPEYKWFNGTAGHYLLGDTITEVPVNMNPLYGSYNDPEAKIIPVKVHRGKQPYDTENNYLIQPKLFAPTKGEGAYWKDFDWNLAARKGMEHVGLDYSGSFDFIETEMNWPLNHMVSPKEESLSCEECHSRNGRLANLNDFYLPGRDYNKTADTAGVIMIIFTILGVAFHGSMRMVKCRRKHS